MAFSKRHLATLLEELQTIVNRMEAGLEDKSDYSYARDRLRETRAELKELKAEKAELKAEIKTLKVVVEESKDTGEAQEPNSTVHDNEDSSAEEVPQ
jgi:cell division protein FtsB